MDLITKDQLLRTLPKELKGRVTDELIDSINQTINNTELREVFRDNLLSFTSVLREGKFKLTGYVDACKFVSYKLLGSSNVEAYTKTFPDRYQRLIDENAPDNTITSYACIFNKSMLVNKILEQTLIPSHVLNADVYQKAINIQADLMMNAKSEKVRTDAANSLLNHLKRPEAAKVQLDISYKGDTTLDELRAATQALVEQQKKLLEERVVSTQYIAESRIIPKDIEDVELVE